MWFALVLAVALALAGGARAERLKMATLAPIEDLSLPFWCDWGYDWDERCYWDDSDRLGIGGVDDKVWRAGIRFSLGALPPKAEVMNAELSLWYDTTCVAPRRETRPCDGKGFEFDAHPIRTPRWRAEREVDFGPLAARALLEPGAPSGWIAWNLTAVVVDWRSNRLANNGILLKLAEGEEDFASSGPAFPSSSYADPALRPRLTVRYRH